MRLRNLVLLRQGRALSTVVAPASDKGRFHGHIFALTVTLLFGVKREAAKSEWQEKRGNNSPYGLYMWGYNHHGNVPYSRSPDVSVPVRVKFFDDKGVRSIHFSERFTAVVDGLGRLYMWGDAVPGSLVREPDLIALGDQLEGDTSELAEDPPAPETTPTGSIARRSTETVGAVRRRTTEVQIHDAYAPRLVATTPVFKQVVCGLDVAYALDVRGEVYLIDPAALPESETDIVTLPKLEMHGIPDREKEAIVHIDSGDSHLVCLTSGGKVLTAPHNEQGNKHGQLGLGHFKNLCVDTEGQTYTKLLPVPGLSHQIVTHIACGSNHTVVLCASGEVCSTEVYGFGSDRNHQLGLGAWKSQKPSCRHSPTYMSGLWPPGTWTGEQKVTAISAGGDNTVLVLEGNNKTQIVACGYGVHGTLGNGTWPHYNGTPTKVKNLCDHQCGANGFTSIIEAVGKWGKDSIVDMSIHVHKVTCGTAHCAAVLDTRYSSAGGLDVYTWGYNKHYQLGNRKRSNTAEPLPVISMTKRNRRLQLSHKDDEHAERTIVCARHNTAVFTPYSSSDDLELDMGRRNSERSRRMAYEWKLAVMQQNLEEVRVERELLKRHFDNKMQANLERETELLQGIEHLQRVLENAPPLTDRGS